MDLFDYTPPNRSQSGDKGLEQYFTPEWAAEELRETFLRDLSPNDLVVDPGCGRGAFIKSIPMEVPAIAVEIDPALAELAAARTGRQVLCGDFRTIEIPGRPTVVFGNPPFSQKVLIQFIDRARDILPENGRCGLLLPAYAFQTPKTVIRWNEEWSLRSTMVPRSLFPRGAEPLVFVMFTKDRAKLMHGFTLYQELSEVQKLNKWAKIILIDGQPHKSTWRALVEEALKRSGGRAHLTEIYRLIEGRRPTSNKWWKEKIRQTLQRHFQPAGDGVWCN